MSGGEREGTILVALAAASKPGDGQALEQEVHLLPAGQFQGRDGRGPYTLADPAAVIEATRRYAGTTKLVVDYDHASDLAAPQGRPAPAAGWIKGLQARADGLWGLVDWPPRAAGLIAGKEYRYLSPVFQHTATGTVRRLLRAALTNSPNLDLTALCSTGALMSQTLAGALAQLLNLPDGSDEAAIVAKVTDLVTRFSKLGELV